jgi:hypothetical protein
LSARQQTLQAAAAVAEPLATTTGVQSIQPLVEALGSNTAAVSAMANAAQLNTDALSAGSGKSSDAGSVAASGIADAIGGGGPLSAIAGGQGPAAILGTINPILGLIAGLLDSGPSTPAPLVPYSMPASVSGEETTTGADLTYGETPESTAAKSGATGATPQQAIQITVQALDNQSIVDHAGDIADAVNAAMLGQHRINDTIANL